jgi:hypothetical protein
MQIGRGRRGETYITKHYPIHTNELRKLPVALVNLSRPAPETSRDAHSREDTVVVKQKAFELFFDKYEILCGNEGYI